MAGFERLGFETSQTVDGAPFAAAVTTVDGAGRKKYGAGAFVDAKTLAIPYRLIDEATTVFIDLGNCETVHAIGIVGVDDTLQVALLELDHAPEGVSPLPVVALPGEGEAVGLHGVLMIVLSDCGFLSVRCDDCLEVLGVYDMADRGRQLVVSQATGPIAFGSPVVSIDGELIGLMQGGAGGGASFVFPAEAINEIARHDPVSFHAFAERELSEAEQVDRLVRSGSGLRVEGKYEEALEMLRQATAINEDSWQAYYEIGVSLDMGGWPVDAMDALLESIDIEPNYAESHFSLGLIRLKSNRPADAVEPLSKAIQLDPYYANARGMLAVAYLNQGKTRDAIAAAEGALALRVVDESHFANLCIMYERVGQTEDVVRVARRWTDKYPSSVQAWSALGENLINIERSAEAVEPLRTALQLGATDVRTHILYVIALGESGRTEEAAAALENGLRKFPDDAMLPQLRGLLEQDRTDRP